MTLILSFFAYVRLLLMVYLKIGWFVYLVLSVIFYIILVEVHSMLQSTFTIFKIQQPNCATNENQYDLFQRFQHSLQTENGGPSSMS